MSYLIQSKHTQVAHLHFESTLQSSQAGDGDEKWPKPFSGQLVRGIGKAFGCSLPESSGGACSHGPQGGPTPRGRPLVDDDDALVTGGESRYGGLDGVVDNERLHRHRDNPDDYAQGSAVRGGRSSPSGEANRPKVSDGQGGGTPPGQQGSDAFRSQGSFDGLSYFLRHHPELEGKGGPVVPNTGKVHHVIGRNIADVRRQFLPQLHIPPSNSSPAAHAGPSEVDPSGQVGVGLRQGRDYYPPNRSDLPPTTHGKGDDPKAFDGQGGGGPGQRSGTPGHGGDSFHGQQGANASRGQGLAVGHGQSPTHDKGDDPKAFDGQGGGGPGQRSGDPGQGGGTFHGQQGANASRGQWGDDS